MKIYEDLSDREQKKLDTYLKCRTISNMRIYIMLLISIMFYVPGVILLFTNNINIFTLGIALVCVSMITILLIILRNEKEDKNLKLVFGIVSMNKDLFKVTESDRKRVKKVTEWKVIEK